MGKRIALIIVVVGASFAIWLLIASPTSLRQTFPQVSEAKRGSGELAERKIESLHLTLEVKLKPGLLEDRWVVEIWQKGEDRLRLEVLESSIPVLRGLTLVRNGSKARLFGPNTPEVIEGEAEKVRLPLAHKILLEAVELVQKQGGNSFSLSLRKKEGEVKILAVEFNPYLADSFFALHLEGTE